jgi:hypothetical protein
VKRPAHAMGVGCLLVLSIGMLSGSASFAANKTDPLVGPEVDTTSGPTEPQLPGPEIPALSSADKSDARAILVDDPRFEDLIQGNSYSISSTSVWTTHSQQKLGAALVVKIANGPVTTVSLFVSAPAGQDEASATIHVR